MPPLAPSSYHLGRLKARAAIRRAGPPAGSQGEQRTRPPLYRRCPRRDHRGDSGHLQREPRVPLRGVAPRANSCASSICARTDRYLRAAQQLGIAQHRDRPTLHPFLEGAAAELGLSVRVSSYVLAVGAVARCTHTLIRHSEGAQKGSLALEPYGTSVAIRLPSRPLLLLACLFATPLEPS